MKKQEYQETHNPILKDLYKKIFIGLLNFAPNNPLFVGEKFIEMIKVLQSNDQKDCLDSSSYPVYLGTSGNTFGYSQ